MPAANLMAKLTEIQRRVESKEAPAIRGLVLAAQEDLLALERTLIATLADNHQLRERLERCERTRPPHPARPLRDLFEPEATY